MNTKRIIRCSMKEKWYMCPHCERNSNENWTFTTESKYARKNATEFLFEKIKGKWGYICKSCGGKVVFNQ